MARRGSSRLRHVFPHPARRGAVTIVGAGAVALLALLVLASTGALTRVGVPGMEQAAVPDSTQALDSVTVFGPKKFATGAVGSPAFHIEEFDLTPNPGALYSLVVRNGEVDGSRRATSIVLRFNGDTLLTEAPFATPDTRVFNQLPVLASNELSLELEGPDSAFVQLALYQSRTPTYVVFGPQEYLRTTGQPQPVDLTFSVGTAAPPYHLFIESGWPDGTDRASSGEVAVNGLEVFGSADFSLTVSSLDAAVDLTQSNDLHVQLEGVPDSRLSVYVTGNDSTPPDLVITSPADSVVTAETSVTINGTVTDATAVQVEVGGSLTAVAPDGTFTLEVPLTTEGENTLTVTATDAAGNQSATALTVVRDTEAPVLTVTDPTDGIFVDQSNVPVTGVVSDLTEVTVSINGLAVEVGSAGGFSGAAVLEEGPGLITVSATDEAGNVTIETRSVTVDLTPPAITVTSPADGTVTDDAEVGVSGTVTDATAVTVTVAGVEVAVDAGGAFQTTVPLAEGENVIVVSATDAAGNQSSVSLSVTREAGESIPPDPSTVAPPLPRTVVTPLADATSFLYEGADPIQRGVAPGAINPVQAAVVRGRVLDQDGAPLSGVRVEVKGHPELGHTLSRLDGGYDLAVNGGAKLTVELAKAGVLPAQRTVEIPWQDYVVLEDVSLITLDTAVTSIDLANLTTPAVARGSVETDADGARQATLIFEPGTQAVMVMPDSAEVPLASLSVRATEYTVGENGPKAMPALLPPLSRYTYAVELSVDEARAAGATTVEFSQPVPFYVEDFLGFPTGTVVPGGYLDANRSAWVPIRDGRVIEVLSTDGGVASVDTDGDGLPEDDTALAALGLDPAERATLATTYAPGSQLWRVELSHFTAHDFNYPGGPRDALQFPDRDLPNLDSVKAENPEPDPCEGAGSIIECQNQVLGEQIPLAGMAARLNYRSDRLNESHVISIPLVGSSVPDSLVEVVTRVRLAGRVFEDTFPPVANQRHDFVWDGRDAYGRAIRGAVDASVEVGYVYEFEYYKPAENDPSFAMSCSAPQNVSSGGGAAIVIDCKSTQLTPGPTERWKGTNWSRRTLLVENPPAGDVGGWSLDPVHVYDHTAQALYLGTGGRARASDVTLEMSRFAGTPGEQGTDGNGGPATAAHLSQPGPLLVLPDGSVIVSRADFHTFGDPYTDIRRVAPDGTITLFANNVQCSGPTDCVDGDLLTEATFQGVTDLALGADGSIFVADGGAIRRISPDGNVTTVIGHYTFQFAGENVPASEADVGYVSSIAVASDGSIYFGDIDDSAPAAYVRRISPDGLVHTVAGGSFSSDENDPCWQDPIQAVGACMQLISDLDVGSDGTLYIMTFWRLLRLRADGALERVAGRLGFDFNVSCAYAPDGSDALSVTVCGSRFGLLEGDQPVFATDPADFSGGFVDRPALRTVDAAGRLVTLAGGNESCRASEVGECAGDGGARSARLDDDLEGLAVGPDGVIYVAEQSLHDVRRITPRLPAFTDGEFTVVAEDGSEVYHFDRAGRHLFTTHALTGATLASMEYDGEGRLTGVVDASGLRTTIERAADGSPTAIVAPFGQRTELSVTPDGLLETAVAPDGASMSLGYVQGGLLASLVDQRGGQHTYAYGAFGRLSRDTDPVGGYTDLSRTGHGPSFSVTKTSALGRTTRYAVDDVFDGGQMRVNTGPAGLVYENERGADGTLRTTAPDGTVTDLSRVADPRWGMQSPLTGEALTTTPGGLTSTVSTSRHAVLADPLNAFSLVSQIDSVTVNGRTFRNLFDAATRTTTSVTPEGRTSTTRVDSLGRILIEKAPGVDSVRYAYDARGRVSSINQGARSWSYAYGTDGLLSSVTDPLLRTAQFAYDANGRLTDQTLPDGQHVGYGYDAAGNLTSVTPPGRPAHTFTYNAVNLATAYRPPAVDTWDPATSYSYDLDRALTQVVRPDGVAIDFTYDAGGRVSEVSFPGGVLAYGYDGVTGNLIGVNGPYGGALAMSYDGSLPTEVEWIGEVSGTVGATYDNDFRITELTVNGAAPVGFSYDDDGLVTSAGALTVSREPATGRVSGTTLGSLGSTQTYSSFGELDSLGWSNSGTPLLDFTYTRDALGRIDTKTETRGGVTRTFAYGYDVAGRLAEVRENGITTEAYTYDGNGNRLQATTPSGMVTGTYDAQDRLLTYGGAAFGYTHNGELTARIEGPDTTRYAYDVLGNLLGVDLPDGTEIDYVVDPVGRRIGRKVDGVLERGWLYQDGLNPVAELDGTGAVVSRFVYGTRANVPEYMVQGGVTYRIVADELGSVRLVVDVGTGAVVQELRYDAWGRVLVDTNPGFQPFGYAGGLYDAATGLVRFGARDYDASVGRWTNKDPISFRSRAPNLYGYAGHDPVNYVDQSGEFPWVTGIVGAVGSGLGNAAAQLFANRGTRCFDWGELGLSIGVGFAAGAAAPYIAVGRLAAAGLGAAANVAQAAASSLASGAGLESLSATDLALAAGTGAIGGLIGGRFRSPEATQWSFSESSLFLDPKLARELNFEDYLRANNAHEIGIANTARATLGGAASNLRGADCPCR